MRNPKIEWTDRQRRDAAIIVPILSFYFGLIGASFVVASFLVAAHLLQRINGERHVVAAVASFVVLLAAGFVSFNTARRLWRRRPDALIWGFACLAIIVMVWLKWRILAEILPTAIASAGLIWLAY